GLQSGVFVSVIAYYPFLSLPVVAALRRLDPAIEDADRDEGCKQDHGSVRHASARQNHSRGPRRDRRLVAGCEQSVVLQQGRCL
ncbi:hypothetical protein AB9F39_35950, partial [Rhizobium leguminosarum]|uniref:hypothetical protein n=1 Tax=Rhizobium leguminosarum TaxID=384 RepID=UPI003F972AF5